MSIDLAMDPAVETDEGSPFAEQVETLFATVERLEDAVAEAAKREQAWEKEKKQLLEANTRFEKKLTGAGDDVKFIKEHLDQAKKEREQIVINAKKERERIIAAAKQEQDIAASEIKQLRHKNKQLKANMERVTSKLDNAIAKIGELMEE